MINHLYVYSDLWEQCSSGPVWSNLKGFIYQRGGAQQQKGLDLEQNPGVHHQKDFQMKRQI